MQRVGRLLFAALTLGVALKFEWCADENYCETGVSHATHAFGALFGLLSGCVFLRVRSTKRPIRIAQNILLVFAGCHHHNCCQLVVTKTDTMRSL